MQYVGVAQGIQGTCVALSAIPGMSCRLLLGLIACCLPLQYCIMVSECILNPGDYDAAGWLADRFRRDRVLKCCAVASCGNIP